MGPKRYNAGPIGTSAKLAGLAGDAILQLSRAGLESDAIGIDPGAALIVRAHHTNGGESLAMPEASLGFRITR